MYDENGMRYRTTVTNKEDNSIGYLDYVWVDSKLISISFTSDELNQTVKYLYNDFDEPVGFVSTREDGSVDIYYYLKNAQGDITNIVSAAGKKMVSFTYDVFGKRTVEYQANGSTNPGQIELLTQMKADLLNPFAYRGYCYDYDMGMYYLQSRYYDPNTGRFINADDTDYLDATGTVLGCNLFAYCENDPVNNVDPKGTWAQYYSGFVRNNVEFSLNVQLVFLSRYFCLSYARDIIRLYGQWYWWGKGYKKMSATRIAQELWFHALAYYVGYPMKWALNKFNISWGWLNTKVDQARYMEINNNDNRAWVFSLAWWSAYAIRTYIRCIIGYGFPFAYIHI